MTYKSLEEKLEAVRQAPSRWRGTRRSARTSIRRSPAEFTNWRDEQRLVARDLRALRPVAPHDRPLPRGPGRDPAALRRSASTSFANFAVEQGQAVRRLQPRRLRDRRRDPLLPRREQGQPRRAALRAQLGAVPRRDRRLRRRRSSATSARPRTRPGAASSTATRCRARPRCEALEKADRRPAARDQVLQHGRAHDRRAQGARAAPRHVRRARAGAVRPVGGGRRRSRRRSSRPARSSACARSARGSTRPTRSSRAGSRARCRPSSPATR